LDNTCYCQFSAIKTLHFLLQKNNIITLYNNLIMILIKKSKRNKQIITSLNKRFKKPIHLFPFLAHKGRNSWVTLISLPKRSHWHWKCPKQLSQSEDIDPIISVFWKILKLPNLAILMLLHHFCTIAIGLIWAPKWFYNQNFLFWTGILMLQ